MFPFLNKKEFLDRRVTDSLKSLRSYFDEDDKMSKHRKGMGWRTFSVEDLMKIKKDPFPDISISCLLEDRGAAVLDGVGV